MSKSMAYLVAGVVLLCAVVSAGPTLVWLAHALVPLVIAVGCVAVLLRLVWYFTNRY